MCFRNEDTTIIKHKRPIIVRAGNILHLYCSYNIIKKRKEDIDFIANFCIHYIGLVERKPVLVVCIKKGSSQPT